jgi:hypothetical protein
MILLTLSLIGIASITTSNSEIQVAGIELNNTGAFDAARAGMEKATALVAKSYEKTGAPPDPLPLALESMDDHKYFYFVTGMGPAVNKNLTCGSYHGLNGLVKSYEIVSQGVDNDLESGVEIEVGLDDALVPLFQFAVFYEGALEIAPAPAMTVAGRVHSNSDVYLVAGNNLFIDHLTSGGNIIKGTPAGAGIDANGDIFIRDRDGNFQNMRNNDGTYLDSNDPDWVDSSSARWGNTIEDRSHSITDLYIPVAGAGNPTDLIDRSTGNPDSYENRAGLKFVDNQALYRQADGTWLDITEILIGDGTISFATFYDERENRNVISLDLDVAGLAVSGYYPSSGIIYASQARVSGKITALRLVNGSHLPSSLTLATNNPLYTLGDFNTVDKQPAALTADAITILSNNWNDANSGLGIKARRATSTTVNAALVTGTTQTGAPGHGYSGGFENLPRMLENWNGITFTWKGSAASLWYSRQATAPWGNTYYNPPIRDWGFDTDFLDPANLPPGTPMLNLIMKTSWNQTVLNDFSHFRHQYDHDRYQ